MRFLLSKLSRRLYRLTVISIDHMRDFEHIMHFYV